MDIIPQNTPQNKQCTKCKQSFPATTEYFYPKSKNSPEFRAACKQCIRKPNDANSPTRICPACKEEKPNTLEFFYSDRKRCKECIGDKCKEYVASHKEQHDAFMRNYYHTHKDRYRENDRAFRKRNPEARKRSIQTYRMKHRERILARNRESRLLHPERAKKYQHDYRARHPERVRETARKTRLKHREKANVYKRNYYARKKQAQGNHTIEDILLQYKRQHGCCYWCNEKVGKEKHEYHVDHIIPLSRGGSNAPDNLVIACPTCNMSKHDRLPHEWPRGGRLL